MLSSVVFPWINLLLATLAISFGMTGAFTWYARRKGMYDIPSARHSHAEPTPRGGGAGLVVAVVVAGAVMYRDALAPDFWFFCVLPGFIVLALVGWWDDRVSLSARLRFLVQLAVSIYLLACPGFTGTFGASAVLLLAGLGLLWMINLYNFMDGSNGMAASQGAFAGSLLGFLFFRAGDIGSALLSAVLVAACLGFLPWNLGRARVFMGDVASASLGFVFGALLLWGVFGGAVAPGPAWLVMLVFFVDATLTLLARVLRGERWYTAHKEHLYQRLIARGWSHGGVLLLYQVINLVLVVPAIAVAVNWPGLAVEACLVATLALGTGWFLAQKSFGVPALAGKG